MTLTFLDLYNECAGQPWSMFDADAENIDDLESALKISINKATSYLWNYKSWSFRLTKSSMKTKTNRAYYELPNGIIIQKTIGGIQRYGVKYNGKFLAYEPNYELLEEKYGEPEKFYIDGENLYIYPTPDNVYVINLTYLLAPFGMTTDDDEIYELVNEDDYVNVPEKYEEIFKNCLISLAMMYAIADESDENYSGYLRQYEDSLSVLSKYCKDSIYDRSFSW